MNAMLQPAGEKSPVLLRARLEAEIERLISLLDALDGDADLEPSLAGDAWGVSDDREGDDADLEPASDDEPALGWVTLASGRIVMGSDTDAEAA